MSEKEANNVSLALMGQLALDDFMASNVPTEEDKAMAVEFFNWVFREAGFGFKVKDRRCISRAPNEFVSKWLQPDKKDDDIK